MGARGLQPLGRSFEIVSPLPSDNAKADLRQKMTGWFETKTGPRGWIVGPFLCLWLSVYDSQGPMIFARIIDDGLGCRIRGRAGSDLNGMVLLLLIAIGAVLFAVWDFVWWGRLGGIALFASCFALLAALAFHLTRSEHKNADPIVRFVRRAVKGADAQCPHAATIDAFDRTPQAFAKLNVSGHDFGVSPSAHDVAETLQTMQPDGFLIIEFGPETYMQTVLNYDRFILERREGSVEAHFRAEGELERADVIDVMTTYLLGGEQSRLIVWEPLADGSMSDTNQASFAKVAYVIGAIFAAMIGVLIWMKIQ